MRRIHASLAAGAAATLFACATVDVHTEYDAKSDFASYKRYAWLDKEPGPEEAAGVRNPAVLGWIRSATDRELTRRGFAKAAETPDFYVAVHGWARDRIEVVQYGYAYAYAPYGYAVYPAGPVADVRQYREGTLLFDFVDAKTMKLFWRGTGIGSVDNATPSRDTVESAVREILEAYPPRVQ